MSSPPSEEDLSSLIERLECIKREIPKDLSARKTLYDVARSLTLALEAPGDSVLRIAYRRSGTFIVEVKDYTKCQAGAAYRAGVEKH